MVNWYDMSSRRHRKILRKRIRSACDIVIGICLFMMLGIIGSVDIGETSLAGFFIYGTINMSILLISAWVRANV